MYLICTAQCTALVHCRLLTKHCVLYNSDQTAHFNKYTKYYIWEDICRQNSDQFNVMNFYFLAFDCDTLGVFRMLRVVSMSR